MANNLTKGFRLRKEYQILPGVRLNISKSGMSLSLGPRGAHVTSGPRGTSLHVDLPGSGLYYQKQIASKKSQKAKEKEAKAEAEASGNGAKALEMGFLQKLAAPPDEVELIEALRAYQAGDAARALGYARDAAHLADGAFLAGMLNLVNGAYEEAANYLNSAWEMRADLGEFFKRYQLDIGIELPIVEDVVAHILPTDNGVLLALSEAYQAMNRPDLAYKTLLELHNRFRDDIMVRLSLAELLSVHYPDDPEIQKQVVELAGDVHNESPMHASLMLYRARALRKLGMLDGAQETLKRALKRKKGYPPELLTGLSYELGMAYEAQGDTKRARKEFEKVYAQQPGYEDVAARLGL